MRTVGAVTSCLFTPHRLFGPHAQGLSLTDEFGISLTKGWAAAALHLFRGKAAVWANHQFLAHKSAGIASEDISAGVKQAFIPPDAAARLNWEWKSL